MRELELAVHPSIDPTRTRGDGRYRFPLPRAAFVASIIAHAAAGYALVQHRWVMVTPPPPRTADFFFEIPLPQPSPAEEAPPAPAPEERAAVEPEATAAVVPLPERPPIVEPQPVPEPAPAVEVPPPAVDAPPRGAETPPPAPATEPADLTEAAPRAYIDFEEMRKRAARDVVTEGAAEKEYLTFSIVDVAPPRPEPEPDKPSIFDGGAGGTRGPSIGQVGQSRTKFGHKMASLCNALTGGFSLMGWGSFCGSGGDSEPSGLFPEIRPAHLDMLPECVDTRDTAPALALEAPFPTVKCRLVKKEDVGVYPP